MVDVSSDRPATFHDIAIVGGGCYGCFYAAQLTKARAREKAAFRRLLIVDRDPGCRASRELAGADGVELVVAEWGEFFDHWLGASRQAGDAIVPSPLRLICPPASVTSPFSNRMPLAACVAVTMTV